MQKSRIQSIGSSSKEIWHNLPTSRKIIIGIASIAVIIGIISLMVWSSRPDYSVLFSDLSPEDMQSIEDELRYAGVPYKLSTDGSSVMVPSEKIHEMRMRLANKGLPETGDIGFESFDKTDYGMTDFAQQLKYQRALQVELARTIKQIKEVMAARVHIVLPRQTIFTDREQPAKASVVLKLRPGSRLEHSQVNGIVHLVASAVEGLQKNNITVLDTSGNMLSSPSEGNYLDNSQLEYQRSVELELESQLQNVLDKVIGYNKSAVQVAAEIDFSTSETSTETYDPDKAVVKNETTSEYTSKGLQEVSGVPGITPSVRSGSSGSPEYNRSESTKEYGLSKTVQHVVNRPGKVTMLSVAVIVDNKMVGGESVPWNQQELRDLESLVRNAVGINVSRGDPEIEIRNIPFDTSLNKEMEEAESASKRDRLRSIIIKAAIGLVAILLLFFIFRSIINRRPFGNDHILPAYEDIKSISGDQSIESQKRGLPLPSQESESDDTEDIQISSIANGKQKIVRAIEEKPETVVRVMRKWLEEPNKL